VRLADEAQAEGRQAQLRHGAVVQHLEQGVCVGGGGGGVCGTDSEVTSVDQS
jgi:hypothetical protein